MNAYIRDLAHAARSLAKDRGFTLVCVISLGEVILSHDFIDAAVEGAPIRLAGNPGRDNLT